jgi:PIN domain nuclease of toxin-antitoxin system
MNYLIDTHTFLWFSAGAPELSRRAKDLIADEENQLFISIASLWEVSIKTALKKLTIVGEYESVLDDVVANSIELMPITFRHTVIQNKLPFHHRDPFDRIIAAQAIAEGMNLISRDTIFDNYFAQEVVKRIW